MNRKQAEGMVRYAIYSLVEANRGLLYDQMVESDDVERPGDRGRLRAAIDSEVELLYDRATAYKDGNPR